jgi:hypothetical protein
MRTEAIVPRHGVVTLAGYGITVRVERGHLLLEDGIGATRCQARFSRVGHGLRRLVVIGADGIVSLASLRWLADQDAAFVMLDRDGSVLATTGAALRMSRELICHKLAAQAQVARDQLLDDRTADVILQYRTEVESAETIDRIRLLESRGAAAYWSLWRTLPISFPKKDLVRVPGHWLSFGARVSPISGSQRRAINPPNAILNYLYAVLEAEARLAAAALGLDPGLGFLHMDTPTRDSLACDIMEPIRPIVDGYLLDWITREPLRREWFFEQRDGSCRLMASLTEKLSETAPNWSRAIAPFAEWVAQTLWKEKSGSVHQHRLATRLTQRHKREAKGQTSLARPKQPPRPKKICRGCGTQVNPSRNYCLHCSIGLAKDQFAQAAKAGRVAAQSAEAQMSRAATQRQQIAARKGWVASSHPAWLDNNTYAERIQPRLAQLACSAVASAIGVSMPYAADIRAGRRRPHPRHWLALAPLVGTS